MNTQIYIYIVYVYIYVYSHIQKHEWVVFLFVCIYKSQVYTVDVYENGGCRGNVIYLIVTDARSLLYTRAHVGHTQNIPHMAGGVAVRCSTRAGGAPSISIRSFWILLYFRLRTAIRQRRRIRTQYIIYICILYVYIYVDAAGCGGGGHPRGRECAHKENKEVNCNACVPYTHA